MRKSGKVPNSTERFSCVILKNIKILYHFSWYFGKISRVEAHTLLLADFNDHGSFLVRESERPPNTFTLSLRNTNDVIHLKINRLDSGRYFISKNRDFENVQSLVEFYLQNPKAFGCKVIAPCERVSLLW